MTIIAWLHNDPERFDVVHTAAKELWLQLYPKQVEHYTIPLVRADEIDALRTRVTELESALRELAGAADDVGVVYFDFDDLSSDVLRLQQATTTARAALDPKP